MSARDVLDERVTGGAPLLPVKLTPQMAAMSDCSRCRRRNERALSTQCRHTVVLIASRKAVVQSALGMRGFTARRTARDGAFRRRGAFVATLWTQPGLLLAKSSRVALTSNMVAGATPTRVRRKGRGGSDRLRHRACPCARRATQLNSFNSRRASCTSAVSKPSVNQASTDASSFRAASLRPCSRRKRARLVAVPSSKDFAP
jgi:hypothetical protein